MFHHLIPSRWRFIPGCDNIQSEKSAGGKSGVLVSEPVECSNEESGDEQHYKTKCGLRCDKSMHQAATRARLISVSKSDCRFHQPKRAMQAPDPITLLPQVSQLKSMPARANPPIEITAQDGPAD